MDAVEAIAKRLWAYPVLHSWLTFEEAKEIPKYKDDVDSTYNQAKTILSLPELREYFNKGNDEGNTFYTGQP